MGTHRTVRRSIALALLAVVSPLAACGGDDDPAPAPAPTSSSLATPETVAPGSPVADGVALSIDPASGLATTPWEPTAGSFGCDGWTGRIITGDPARTIDIAMWGPECVATEGLNGQRVQYRAAADVLSGEVVETQQVAAGTATVIDDVYVECTNDCTEYEDRIVLVELDAPADERFPSVMISTLDDVPFDDLLAVAESLQVGAPG